MELEVPAEAAEADDEREEREPQRQSVLAAREGLARAAQELAHALVDGLARLGGRRRSLAPRVQAREDGAHEQHHADRERHDQCPEQHIQDGVRGRERAEDVRELPRELVEQAGLLRQELGAREHALELAAHPVRGERLALQRHGAPSARPVGREAKRARSRSRRIARSKPSERTRRSR